MDYFLMSRADWRFSAQDLPRQLLSRWPTASIEQDEDPESNHRFDFRLPMAHSELHGALNRDGDALIFFADFATAPNSRSGAKRWSPPRSTCSSAMRA